MVNRRKGTAFTGALRLDFKLSNYHNVVGQQLLALLDTIKPNLCDSSNIMVPLCSYGAT